MAEPTAFGTWAAEHRGPLSVDDDFTVLDDPFEQQAFTTQTENEGTLQAQSTLVVQGMYCAACADAVTAAIAKAPGVLTVDVSAATRRVTVTWDPMRTRVSTWARAVGDTGYRLLPAADAHTLTERMREGRSALLRLFIAGFCTMQVMMYAWPDYVAAPGEIPPDIAKLLRLASFVLTLPVLFLAASTFFKAAWRDAKLGRIGMDTPVSVGIIVAFASSTAATFYPTGPWGSEVWFDSLTMFIFFLLAGRYWELKARDRTAGALDAIMHRLPQAVLVRAADGREQLISARRLVVDDTVIVATGQALPADGIALDDDVTLDESLLTGESRPVHHVTGDGLIAGSLNVGGPFRLRVTQVGRDTRFAAIVSLMERASTEKPRLAQLADRIASPFLIVVFLLAIGAGLVWWRIEPQQALSVAVAVLIVTCPCALSLATPTAMLATAGRLAKGGVLVRRLQALETLAKVDMVVFDKTGTLTHDQLHVAQAVSSPALPKACAWALAGALAKVSAHPASQAIVKQSDPVVHPALSAREDHTGRGVSGRDAEGQLWHLGSWSFATANVPSVSSVAEAPWAGPQVYLVCQSDATQWARFDLNETLRPDAAHTLRALQAAGLSLALVSGDQNAAVTAVADRLNESDLPTAPEPLRWLRVQAGASPQEKLACMQQWQASGRVVAMVGDGVNDAPVLAQADVSFTLGQAAALVQNRADYVIQSGQLAEIVAMRTAARATMRVVKQNLVWALCYNVMAVPLAMLGWLPPWAAGLGMALSSLVVVVNATRLSGDGLANTAKL